MIEETHLRRIGKRLTQVDQICQLITVIVLVARINVICDNNRMKIYVFRQNFVNTK